MLNNFIFIIMPYTALALLVFVTPYRFFSNRLTWSAYSTQFLERKSLFWGVTVSYTHLTLPTIYSV